ncbi:MAG: AAA family ATPase [Candidatus Nanoarchaeia archaeon]|nr:AAA family ATPase [Candidatus Nanoarchaeia archaeon]
MIENDIDILKKLVKEDKGLTCIFGESATGKSTFCLMSSIKEARKNNKVVFLDTEGSFSVERIKQMNGKDCLDNILLMNIKNFREQQDQIKNLSLLSSKVSLIVIDTLTHHYRNLIRKKPELARVMLLSQLRMLKKISEKIPVLITSQVYQDINNNVQKPVGGGLLIKEVDNLIKLVKEPRKALLLKPERNHIYFRIENEGIFEN